MACLTVINGTPHVRLHEYLLDLSMKYPKQEIITETAFEEDCFTKRHIVRYANGVDEQTGLEPQYMINCDRYTRQKLGDELLETIADIAGKVLCRVDSVTKDDNGNFNFVSPPGEVTYTFGYHGYKIEAIKYQCQIDITVYQRTGEWEELEEADYMDDDVDDLF